MARKERISFDNWYEEIYGERWDQLREALLREPVYMELKTGLVKPYFLDKASFLAARSLGVSPGDTVLDMCAAPGGKTLVLATALEGTGRLVANDRSATRRERLRRVISEYLPEAVRSAVEVTSHDATRWGLYERAAYDRVLLDVPCSSERHVINSPIHLQRWSPSRSRHLAVQAYAMLSAAYTAAKPGGTIVYSTCALSPLENDGVLAKLFAKHPATLLPVQSCPGEPTEYGVQISPDTDNGMGPIYIARVLK